jgi:hypothetical protein
MIEIRHRETNEIIYSGHFADVRKCLEDGIEKHISFAYANLAHANLTHANLPHIDLTFADLSHADMSHANLRDATLNYADLSYARLFYAKLSHVDWVRVDLTEADLVGADLDYTSWPLWCGSTEAIIDDQLSKQLVYHAMCVMNKEQKAAFLKDPIAWANGFHRVGDVKVIYGSSESLDEIMKEGA